MKEEARPWSWMLSLTPASKKQVTAILKKAGLGDLAVIDMEHEHFLAVMTPDTVETSEEALSSEIEQAEKALNAAGYGMYVTRRKTSEGWLSAWIQVCGKSAEGVGPRTIQRTQQVKDVLVADLSTTFWG